MDQDRAIAKLQAAIRVPTVSEPDQRDPATFTELHAQLRRDFPLLHEQLELLRIGEQGLLFHWPGTSSERPVVLMAHQDVVPVEGEWQHPAFSGDIVDGQIWGRGTLDDKGCLVAICEAVERHLEDGFVPAQDIWLSFGADEEVYGVDAPLAVEELARRGVRPWLVLDEGGAVASGAFPGIKIPIAVIGVTEKGATSLELSCEGRGGHASTPAKWGPTARIARAVVRLEKVGFPASLPAPSIALFQRLAPHAPWALRPVLANADRLSPALQRILAAAGAETAAIVRTTVAVTMLSGSSAINVIASKATAGVNIRIQPGETVAQVVDQVRRTIDDSRVAIDVVAPGEPSPISPYTDDPAFQLLETTIGEVYRDAVAAPYVVMGATDSRHFATICERVYRFAPFRMSKQQREAIHSYDERIGVQDFLDGIDWYHRLIGRIT